MGSFSQIERPASWQLALWVVEATFLSHQGKPSRLLRSSPPALLNLTLPVTSNSDIWLNSTEIQDTHTDILFPRLNGIGRV